MHITYTVKLQINEQIKLYTITKDNKSTMVAQNKSKNGSETRCAKKICVPAQQMITDGNNNFDYTEIVYQNYL